jgi:hypothetical protein
MVDANEIDIDDEDDDDAIERSTPGLGGTTLEQLHGDDNEIDLGDLEEEGEEDHGNKDGGGNKGGKSGGGGGGGGSANGGLWTIDRKGEEK